MCNKCTPSTTGFCSEVTANMVKKHEEDINYMGKKTNPCDKNH